MARIKSLALLVLLALATNAHASGWYYSAVGGGWYVRIDSHGQNDNWYYKRGCECGHCGRQCGYVRSHKFGEYAKTYGQGSSYSQQQEVAYTKNWKTDLISLLDRQKDNELFLSAVRESGLRTPGGSLGVYGSEYRSNGSGDTLSGLSYYRSGYGTGQGSTLYGLAAYTPSIGQVDIDGTLHMLKAVSEQQAGLLVNANNALSDRVGQVSEAQTEIARIQEAGKVIIETVKAAQRPSESLHQWERKPGEPSASASDHKPSRVSIDGSMDLVRTQVLFNQHCLECHSGEKPKKGLDLTNFAPSFMAWGPGRKVQFSEKIWDRVTSNDPKFMMPPDGHQPLNPDELDLLKRTLVFGN